MKPNCGVKYFPCRITSKPFYILDEFQNGDILSGQAISHTIVELTGRFVAKFIVILN
jgi:hypothetical protein